MEEATAIFHDPSSQEMLLTEVGALNYFKLSPFYSKTCNNEKLRVNEGVEALRRLQGSEYVVDMDMSSPPRLWVIRR